MAEEWEEWESELPNIITNHLHQAVSSHCVSQCEIGIGKYDTSSALYGADHSTPAKAEHCPAGCYSWRLFYEAAGVTQVRC